MNYTFLKGRLIFITYIIFLLSTGTLSQATCSEFCQNGECRNNECNCKTGYFHDPKKDVKDCSLRFLDEYGSTWDAMRAVQATLYGIIAIIGFIGFVASLPQVKKGSRFSQKVDTVPVINIKPLVLGATTFLAVVRLIYNAVDPRGLRGYFPSTVNVFLYGSFWWLALFGYVATLFHWIDLYNASVTMLRKEDMMQKINQNYKGKAVTLEDLISKVKFLKKLTIPFVIIVTAVFIFEVIKNIVNSYEHSPPLDIAFFIYNSLNWIALSLGYLIYGRRLLNLMPPQLFKKIRKLTRKITALSILIMVIMTTLYIIFTPAFGINNGSPDMYLLEFTFVENIIVILTFATMSVFFKWNRKFLFFLSSNSQTSGRGPNFDSESTIDMQTNSMI